jgi:hypothetical protein
MRKQNAKIGYGLDYACQAQCACIIWSWKKQKNVLVYHLFWKDKFSTEYELSKT